jgi:hypothetical protein
VLGNGLDGKEGLLTDRGILLVGKLLLESLDSPEGTSHVSSDCPIWDAAHESAVSEKFSSGEKRVLVFQWWNVIRREVQRGPTTFPLAAEAAGP